MSTRGLYRLDDGTFVRTQAEIPKGQAPNKIEVPIGSQELCDFLNQLVSISPTIETQEEVAAVPFAPPPAPTSTREQFEEAWDGFPLALKCHYAAMAMEDCRTTLKQEHSK